ncbi:MAG: sucrase ferredoxin [Devosia sp.]
MGKHVFCTDLCLERGEPLVGTGDAPQRILMLAWPRGKWRTPRWESVDMSPALMETLHDAAHAHLHVALVDKVEAEGSLPTLHALPENVFADFAEEGDLIAAIRDYVEGRVFAGQPDPRSTILCCTDSRRDACCARHGFSTYKALVAEADPARFNIVQATHIGGCRFAASLVVMPQRQRYGRMTAAQAPDFLTALGQDEVYLPAYKGRTDQPEPLQVAELAAMGWARTHGHRIDDVVLDPASPPDDAPEGTTLVLTAAVGPDRLAIHMHAQSFLVQGNCSTVAEGGGKDTIRWCLDAVLPNSQAGALPKHHHSGDRR